MPDYAIRQGQGHAVLLYNTDFCLAMAGNLAPEFWP